MDATDRRDVFVGRDLERRVLEDALEAALSGAGGVVSLIGPAGIGKTRLCQEIADGARHRGAVVAWGHCSGAPGAPPYWPWHQITGTLNDHLPSDAALGDPATGADPFAFTTAFVTALRHLDGVMAVLDDLHAADESSVQLARLVAQQLPRTRALLVVTCREDELEPGSFVARTVTAIGRLGGILALEGLDPDAVAACFQDVAGYPPPPGVHAAVLHATGGNPFFVKEMARTAGDLHRPDRSAGFRVPRGISELIDEQLARADQAVRRTLSAAAVVGSGFALEVVAAVCDIDETTVAAHIDAAARARIVEEDPTNMARFRFTHVLLRDSIYQSIPPRERAALHLAAARVMERTAGGDIGELADHYFKAGVAGDLRKALEYSAQAGGAALERSEHDSAARHFHRALKVAETIRADPAVRDELAASLARCDALTRRDEGRLGSAEDVFRREGDYWTVCFGGTMTRLKDAKGLRHLGVLLANPGQEFLALDLTGSPAAKASDPASVGGEGLHLEGRGPPVLDDEARAAYKARLEDLRAEADDAEANNDPERSARARQEMDVLTRELSRAIGLGGRARTTSGPVERARMSVTRAIRSAIERIEEVNPALGRHLAATVRTGTYVSYSPDPRVPIRWEL